MPILYINGTRVPHKLAIQARPNQTLLSFLRDVMHLTGSKLGCAEGGCGACTVMVSKRNGDAIKYVNASSSFSVYSRMYVDGVRQGKISQHSSVVLLVGWLYNRHYAVNACLMPVLAADGCHVTTVEGIGTVKGDNLHPVQQAMVDMHGSQCGT